MRKHLRRFFAFTFMAAFMAALLIAANPGGDWKGSFEFNGNDVPLTFHLKVTDTTLTGTVEGLSTTPAEIQDGKVDGDIISFTATTDYHETPVKLVYKGKVDGDEIKFSMGTDDGGWGVEFVAKRST